MCDGTSWFQCASRIWLTLLSVCGMWCERLLVRRNGAVPTRLVRSVNYVRSIVIMKQELCQCDSSIALTPGPTCYCIAGYFRGDQCFAVFMESFLPQKRTHEILNTCIQNILHFVPEVKQLSKKCSSVNKN